MARGGSRQAVLPQPRQQTAILRPRRASATSQPAIAGSQESGPVERGARAGRASGAERPRGRARRHRGRACGDRQGDERRGFAAHHARCGRLAQARPSSRRSLAGSQTRACQRRNEGVMQARASRCRPRHELFDRLSGSVHERTHLGIDQRRPRPQRHADHAALLEGLRQNLDEARHARHASRAQASSDRGRHALSRCQHPRMRQVLDDTHGMSFVKQRPGVEPTAGRRAHPHRARKGCTHDRHAHAQVRVDLAPPRLAGLVVEIDHRHRGLAREHAPERPCAPEVSQQQLSLDRPRPARPSGLWSPQPVRGTHPRRHSGQQAQRQPGRQSRGALLHTPIAQQAMQLRPREVVLALPVR